MVSLTVLWLPIVLAAVAVFLGSSVIHMVLPYHRSDHRQLPGQDEISAEMRKQGVGPGHYFLPHFPDLKSASTPEAKETFALGPVALISVLPKGAPSMGKPLALWFGYCLLVGVAVAYLTGRTVGPGAEYLEVFRVAGTTAFLAFAGANPAESIWRGLPWSNTLKNIFDGLIYGLLTAGVFAWLWPA